jgi:hypothetical protein
MNNYDSDDDSDQLSDSQPLLAESHSNNDPFFTIRE